MNKGVYASWEVQHGFNNEYALRSDESRVSEYELKPLSHSLRLLSRSQWKVEKRKVLASDSEAAKVVVSRNSGHKLCLFSEEQTMQI